MLRDGDSVRKDTVSHLRSSVAGRFRFAGHCLYSHWASTHLFNISGIESVSDRFNTTAVLEALYTYRDDVATTPKLRTLKRPPKDRISRAQSSIRDSSIDSLENSAAGDLGMAG
ncbi:hypothetical protein VTO73DRAFT_2713 [Trametes versicolor]